MALGGRVRHRTCSKLIGSLLKDTEQHLKQCLDEYERFEVWSVSADNTSVTFIN